MKRVIGCILVAVVFSQTCLAQVPPPAGSDWAGAMALRRGVSLRVETREGKNLKGKFDSLSATKLSLNSNSRLTEVDRSGISRLFQTSGSKGNSMAIGALIGAGSGAALGAAAFNGKGYLPSRGQGAAGLAVLGAGVGVLVGLVVRAARHNDKLIYEAR